MTDTKQQAQCEGKDPLPRSVAVKVARRMNKTAAQRRGVVAYRCPHCGKWHVGGQK